MAKFGSLAGLLLTLLIGVPPAWGAGDFRTEDLALCRGSWLDWKDADAGKFDSFGAFLRSAFAPNGDDGSLVPKSPIAIAGLRVTRVFPQNVGMGLGFSVLVDATFDVAKTALEQALGKPLHQCESGEGMRTCELPIAERRTVVLMSSDRPGAKTALVGCYYLYEE